MKISQENTTFQPITITLEIYKEAEAFIAIIDQCDRFFCNANHKFKITKEYYEIVRKISDAWTLGLRKKI